MWGLAAWLLSMIMVIVGGARQAVDEYLSASKLNVMLHRIDYTGRIFIVP